MTFCSAGCVHGWKVRTSPQYVRQCLFRRDHGVCATCGVDTVQQVREVERQYGALPPWVTAGTVTPDRDTRQRYQGLRARLRELQIPWHRWNSRARHRGIWDADHILPVVEGGGECGLENFRTLCLACHGDETRRLRRRLREPKSYELL